MSDTSQELLDLGILHECNLVDGGELCSSIALATWVVC
jgi:hypothetical protein